MKKACYLIGAPGGGGAVAGHFSSLGLELARRGHDVKIISSLSDVDAGSAVTNPARLAWPSPRPTRLADALFLARLIRRCQPDCMVANFGAVNWMCLVGWLCRVKRRIAFYHTLSTQVEGDRRLSEPMLPKLLRLRKRMVYRSATILAGISQVALRDAQKTYGVPAEKCRLWRYSMTDPANRIQLLPAEGREDIIVCTGRFSPSKGQDILLSAIGTLASSNRNTQVEFLGEGPMLERCRALAQRLGIADRCHFRGRVAPEQVIRRMAGAKLTVVPSRAEAFGLVNVESLAVGTPVIASRVDGIPEIIRDGVDGWLVPPGDASALAEKIGLLLQDDALRAAFGHNARQRFLEMYEDSAVVRKQADWLDELVQPVASGGKK